MIHFIHEQDALLAALAQLISATTALNACRVDRFVAALWAGVQMCPPTIYPIATAELPLIFQFPHLPFAALCWCSRAHAHGQRCGIKQFISN